MLIRIDFSSEEALYMQLRNQIILQIASAEVAEGESLPSVRQMAEEIGINMHTVNKAYALLRQEGFVKLDRRRGAMVAIDADHARAAAHAEQALRVTLAEAVCRGVTRQEIHTMVDRIIEEYEGDCTDE